MIDARVVAEVIAERVRQEEKHGGPIHDDQLHPEEWVSILARHLDRALEACDADTYRRQLLRVSAVCIAAVESLDRRMEDAARLVEGA